ncbi:TPA: hypothetical protein N0F65_004786 [Lagenidium giganteum]|uniref:Uncharacterized protein n=1 Tax=Lagenidium giganteum TaxID=4803 RepID=A0AAV2Z753_9STRA|nr:TPA: hypothetical protein N0F65_004786 [Lagenidium giganteum]
MTEAEVLDALQLVVESEATAHSLRHGDANAAASVPAMDTPTSVTMVADLMTHGDRKPRTAAKEQKAASTSNVYQNRQKQELMYLKSKVRELESELAQLEEKRAVDGEDSIWQRVAEQQNVEKQKAMSENARLKGALEEQIKFGRQLERIIRKRPNLSAFGGPAFPTFRRKRKMVTKNLHEELLESVRFEYPKMARVLRESGASSISRDARTMQVSVLDDERDGSCVIRVEVCEIRRFPFKCHAVAREIWKFLCNASLLEQTTSGISRKVDVTDDQMVADTNLEFSVGSRVGLLQTTAAFQRFDDEQQAALVYVSQGECERKRNAKDTFKVTEKGWTSITPLTNDAGADGCILRCVSYFYPTLSENSHYMVSMAHNGGSGNSSGESSPSDEVSSNRSNAVEAAEESEEVGILTELIFGQYKRATAQIYSLIENTLMEELLSSTTGGSPFAS